MSAPPSPACRGAGSDPETLKANTRPELVKYAAITAESKDKMWIPLFSSFEKSLKWDESLRQIIHKKTPKKRDERTTEVREGKEEQKPLSDEGAKSSSAGQPQPDPKPGHKELSADEAGLVKCDIGKLETLVKNNFEVSHPFRRGNPDYTWYYVNDLARLSNIMYMSGINVPVFANPKILVGLFRYKHILAGLYKGENQSNFFVIGVPARGENDNRPFETACRWVPVSGSDIRDLGGYWLVYVSLRTGEIVV